MTEGYIIVKINDMVIYDSEDLERALKAAGDEGVFVTAVSPRGRVELFRFFAAGLKNVNLLRLDNFTNCLMNKKPYLCRTFAVVYKR